MLKVINLICLTVLFVVGCATTPPPVLNLSEKTRVGIINTMDNEATHTHFGTTVFTNFIKKYPVTWNFPEKMETEMISNIEKSTGYEVLKLKPTKELLDKEDKILDMTWSIKLNPELSTEIKDIMYDNNVDVLIIIRDFGGEDYVGGTGKYIHGYGLYTRTFLGIKTAHAYAYANVASFHGNPPRYVGGGTFIENPHLEKFKFPKDLKEIDYDNLNGFGYLITDNIPEFCETVLIRSGLKPNKSEKK